MSAIHGILAGTITALGTGMVTVARKWPLSPARSVLDEAAIGRLLDGDEIEANAFEYCPAEARTTFHALRTDGSRRCWTCHTETPAGGAA